MNKTERISLHTLAGLLGRKLNWPEVTADLHSFLMDSIADVLEVPEKTAASSWSKKPEPNIELLVEERQLLEGPRGADVRHYLHLIILKKILGNLKGEVNGQLELYAKRLQGCLKEVRAGSASSNAEPFCPRACTRKKVYYDVINLKTYRMEVCQDCAVVLSQKLASDIIVRKGEPLPAGVTEASATSSAPEEFRTIDLDRYFEEDPHASAQTAPTSS